MLIEKAIPLPTGDRPNRTSSSIANDPKYCRCLAFSVDCVQKFCLSLVYIVMGGGYPTYGQATWAGHVTEYFCVER